MHLLQKRPTKIGTRLLGSKMPVPIPRSRTVMGSHGYKRVEAICFVRIFKTIQIYLSIVIPAGDLSALSLCATSLATVYCLSSSFSLLVLP